MRILFHLVVVILMATPGVLTAQQIAGNTSELAKERELISQMIDSLENRIGEIDQLLSQVDPAERLEAMISKYGKNKGRMIADGKVWPTISYEMAKDSWGEPNNIQSSAISSGTTQKWTYSDKRYLYFKNGSLESWSK